MHLCQYMPRRKDARRQVADPTNEPDFYRIARKYPLDVKANEEVPAQGSVAAKRQRTEDVVRSGPTLMTMAATPASFGNPVLPPPAAMSQSSPEMQLLLSLLEAQKKQREEEAQRAALTQRLASFFGASGGV